MENFVLGNEVSIRLSFFFGILTVMAILEILSPRRKLLISKFKRWSNNLALTFLNSIVLRLLFPAAAVGVATIAQDQNWGLLNYFKVPFPVAVVFTVIFMDMIVYLQHVLFHAVPGLWRLHRVHHADMDYDVTTGARFHTLEIIISMIIKFATVVALGAPVVGVIFFEIMLNATAMFNHANFKLNTKIDKILRLFVVTPDMHRVHHSTIDHEANSNFGFSMPWWDRFFGTYKESPEKGHEGMDIGIRGVDSEKEAVNLFGMLWLPFKAKISGYTINARKWN